jgi:hypothetical protein
MNTTNTCPFPSIQLSTEIKSTQDFSDVFSRDVERGDPTKSSSLTSRMEFEPEPKRRKIEEGSSLHLDAGACVSLQKPKASDLKNDLVDFWSTKYRFEKEYLVELSLTDLVYIKNKILDFIKMAVISMNRSAHTVLKKLFWIG